MFANTRCQWAMGHSDKSVFGRLQKQREGLHVLSNDSRSCFKINRGQGRAAHEKLTSQYGTHPPHSEVEGQMFNRVRVETIA